MRRHLLALVLLLPVAVRAQQALRGFAPATARQEATLEAALQRGVDPAMARRHMHALAARPHVAGTPAQVATADYVLREMASWGLDTSRATFEVFLPFQDSTVVEMLAPTRHRFDLSEPVLDEDPTTRETPWPAMNGYAGAGDVTGPVIYVNYGLPDDYDRLDSLGISVRGAVVLARYGRSFRGIKAREAERHGAVGLLLYSDPMDDGFLVGEVYPEGPMRNPDGVQRGSLLNGQGDPSTPGWASLSGARRIDEAAMNVPRIPVVPMGYGNAGRFLEALRGPSVPDGWQGGLGYRYHLGDGSVRARVAVWPEQGAARYKTILNTFGVLRGTTFPEELVIIGTHRDAWSPGALDDVSGTVSVLEAARTWAEAARAGRGPARTLVFATWDAEEWGLIGSTEWVEAHADSLARSVVAYLNQDVIASGPSFGASGTASLQALVREVTAAVPQPRDSVSVYRDWERRTTSASRPKPVLGDLGGGSDFMGFYNHLGIPAVGFGFGGPGGSYHSGYDTWSFVERFADPGYEAHVASARVAALLLARLGNAEVVPFEYGDLGAYLGTLVDRTRREPGADRIEAALDELDRSAAVLARAGERFAAARDASLGSGAGPRAFEASNATLRTVEQAMLDPAGLPGRPFLRNLLFASDRDNGYANVQLPAIVEALRDDDLDRAARAARELAGRVREAAARVAAAEAALPGSAR